MSSSLGVMVQVTTLMLVSVGLFMFAPGCSTLCRTTLADLAAVYVVAVFLRMRY